MRRSEYFASDRGKRSLHLHRSIRRVSFDIEGVEPRSKNRTRSSDAVAIQEQVLGYLRKEKRRAFRGGIVLSLEFRTTDRNPAHIHTIAKNLLDLLGRPLPELRTRRKGLLYFDDSQVHGLVVRCGHGADAPTISVDLQSLSDFREELALGVHAASRMSASGRNDERERQGPLFDLAELTRDREMLVSAVGEESYRALETMARRDTQRQLLNLPRLRIEDLAYLFRATSSLGNTPRKEALDLLGPLWESSLATNPFRLLLQELPTASGSSGAFKGDVGRVVQGFRDRFAKLLDPLLNPVALEVIVKPPRAASAAIVHDLDNVVRRYMIPEVLSALRPPSDIAYTFAEARVGGAAAPWADRLKRLPKSAAIGVIRYEVWRIPRSLSDNGAGFVSAGVVADDIGYNDTLTRLDRLNELWAASVG